MRTIGIVCDACGHHAADVTGRTAFVRASTEVAASDSSNPSPTGIAMTCACCGALWELLHPGDEFLVGVSRVVRARAARAASIANA